MYRRFLVVLAVVAWHSVCGMPASAQGNPPYLHDQVIGGTGGKFEHIDLANGGVNLTIPLVRSRDEASIFGTPSVIRARFGTSIASP